MNGSPQNALSLSLSPLIFFLDSTFERVLFFFCKTSGEKMWDVKSVGRGFLSLSLLFFCEVGVEEWTAGINNEKRGRERNKAKKLRAQKLQKNKDGQAGEGQGARRQGQEKEREFRREQGREEEGKRIRN